MHQDAPEMLNVAVHCVSTSAHDPVYGRVEQAAQAPAALMTICEDETECGMAGGRHVWWQVCIAWDGRWVARGTAGGQRMGWQMGGIWDGQRGGR